VLRDKVRAALAGTTSFEEFTERLRREGALVRLRMSTVNPEEVTGYAVALPPRAPTSAQASGLCGSGAASSLRT
jgi:hypothetical protein